MNNAPEVRHVLVIEDQKSRRIVSLHENTYTIGRDPNNTIILYDRQVSRYHATLLRINDYQSQRYSYRIIDGTIQGKRSTNGITVNGQTCLTHELKNGDTIRFGSKSQIGYQLISLTTDTDGELSKEDLLAKATLVPMEESLDPSLDDPIPELLVRDYAAKTADSFPDSFDQDDGALEDALATAILYGSGNASKTNRDRVSLTANPDGALVESSPQAIFELTFEGKLTYLNPAAISLFPELATARVGHPLVDGIITLSPPENGISAVREIALTGKVYEQHICYVVEKQRIRCYVVDITPHKAVSAERYQIYQQLTTEPMLWIDGQTKAIIEVNSAYCQLLGYDAAELSQLSLDQLLAVESGTIPQLFEEVPENEPKILENVAHRRADGSTLQVSMQLYRKLLENREVYCCTIHPLPTQTAIAEPNQSPVLYDPLTELPNRQYFNQQLAIALEHAQRHQHLLAILFFDLDSFKNINNSLGHRIGDQVLKAFGQQIQSCIRSDDTLCRWGGDEFCVLLPHIKNADDTVKLTQRLFDKLRQPIEIESHEFHLKSSIGIAIYPQDGEDSETLLKNADTALHRTKKEGRNHYQFYNSSLGAEATLLLRLENLLDQAIARKQLSLQYQPQVNLKTGAVTGIEALLRWENPEVGFIPPAKFIPLAAKTDLIFQISKWVLKTACEQNLSWQKNGLPAFPVAVNLCAKEFHYPRLVETIAQTLAETGLDPHWLEIEITESTLRLDPTLAQKTLKDLKSLGVRIALDDFGTGYSALSYLKLFPLHTLKIDQHFIRDLRSNPHDLALISAILAMGRGYNLRIIAEGIENEYQLNTLRNLQCEEAQGYWFSRPLKTKEATQFLQQQFLT
ncbi:MAG: EAL domain-containing protein [Snowella sp.]|nr:EAL domain-containing protein [Snowella sp.]